VADRFLGLLEAPELEEGVTAGFFGRESAAEIVVDVQLEMRVELGVQFPFEVRMAEKVAETRSERTEPGHGGALLWATKRRIVRDLWESNRKKRRDAKTWRWIVSAHPLCKRRR